MNKEEIKNIKNKIEGKVEESQQKIYRVEATIYQSIVRGDNMEETDNVIVGLIAQGHTMEEIKTALIKIMKKYGVN